MPEQARACQAETVHRTSKPFTDRTDAGRAIVAVDPDVEPVREERLRRVCGRGG